MSDKIYVYPTDTVWGIGANIYSKIAHEKIAEIKGSRDGKPFSILFPSLEMAQSYLKIPVKFLDHLEVFELGFTLLLPLDLALKEIPLWVRESSPFIGFRVLSLLPLKNVIESEGAPITTTSLNRSGESPILDNEEALQFFKSVRSPEVQFVKIKDLNSQGTSSTIVQYENGVMKIIREGKNITVIKGMLGL